MQDVFVVSDNILSPLGITTADNFAQLSQGFSGVKEQVDKTMSPQPFYAALFGRGEDFIRDGYTKFELLLIASIGNALENSGIDTRDKKTILIISSTKGNIDLLESEAAGPALAKRMAMHTSAGLVARHFGFIDPPIIVSTACISGIAAILTGMRLVRSGRYENAVIAGADTLSKFVLSGFQAFQAISAGPCKPFDRARSGINLGEGAGTLILSSQKGHSREKDSDKTYSDGRHSQAIKVMGGAISNDANHLSAPSRTGEELSGAILKALRDSGLSTTDIDFISAHGTATLYNDEMEAKAITLANLRSVPVNSLKGYYGHTLGAAGLIESIVSIQSLRKNLVLPTMGFEEMGVSAPLNICTASLSVSLNNCLKTASGFGGCNAALVLGKQ